jgi:hypothetical protein
LNAFRIKCNNFASQIFGFHSPIFSMWINMKLCLYIPISVSRHKNCILSVPIRYYIQSSLARAVTSETCILEETGSNLSLCTTYQKNISLFQPLQSLDSLYLEIRHDSPLQSPYLPFLSYLISSKLCTFLILIK